MRLHLATLALAAVAAFPAAAQTAPDAAGEARLRVLASRADATARAERLVEASRVPARVLGTATATRGGTVGAPLETSYQDTYNLVEGTWGLGGRTDYTYTSGRMTGVTERYWMADAWSNSSRTETTYDGDRALTSRFDVWNGTAWAPSELATYTYTGTTGHQVTSARWQNGDWQSYERMRYTLSGGIVVSAQRDTLRSGTWTPIDRFTFVEDGGAVVQTNGIHNGTAWVATDRTIYDNQTLASLNAAYLDMEASLLVGGVFSIVLPDHRDELWTGSTWRPAARQTTTRTGTGRPETVTIADWDGMGWEASSRSVFLYGSGDLLTAVSVELPGEVGWETVFSEAYTHENGRLVEAVTALQVEEGTLPTSRMRYLYASSTNAPADERPVSAVTLGAPAPNPVRDAATLGYTLDAPGSATLALYDLTGRHVATLARGPHAAGAHSARLDATSLPAGVYLARLTTADGAQATRRIVVAR